MTRRGTIFGLAALVLLMGLSGCSGWRPAGPALISEPARPGLDLERRAPGEQVAERLGQDQYQALIQRDFTRLKLSQSGPQVWPQAENFSAAVAGLAARLEAGLAQAGLRKEEVVVLPATFVNLDDLRRTSTFGRLGSELLAAGLKERGLKVLELRRAREVTVDPAGELILTRRPADLAGSHQAGLILTGTYAVTAWEVVLSVRLVQPEGDFLAAGATAVFDRRDNLFINSLLLNEAPARSPTQTPALVKLDISPQFKTARPEPAAQSVGPLKPAQLPKFVEEALPAAAAAAAAAQEKPAPEKPVRAKIKPSSKVKRK